jgi:hypothetical protein
MEAEFARYIRRNHSGVPDRGMAWVTSRKYRYECAIRNALFQSGIRRMRNSDNIGTDEWLVFTNVSPPTAEKPNRLMIDTPHPLLLFAFGAPRAADLTRIEIVTP